MAEIHDIPKSLEKTKTKLLDKLSPASIVEELPTFIVPLSVQDNIRTCVEVAEDSNSIGMLVGFPGFVLLFFLHKTSNFLACFHQLFSYIFIQTN